MNALPEAIATPATRRAWRASLLRFDVEGQPVYESDGLLITEQQGTAPARVLAAGDWSSLRRAHLDVPVTDLSGHLIAPGFIDLHVHYPQTDVMGSPADGLLPWLNTYTFPQETRFAERSHADEVAAFFLDQLLAHGVTTALVFATSHPASVDAFFEAAQRRRLRMITGKCLMDRFCPDGVRDDTEQSLTDTETLIGRWHGQGRLGYAITPRFACTSTPEQLRGAGELAGRYPDVWVQSHVAENFDEIRWARELFPASRSYLSTYDDFGLMRRRSVYAHCIHFDGDDRALMRERHTAAAVCPTSNLFLGSGFFDFDKAQSAGFAHALASDVGGGTSLSPLATMAAAYHVGREGQTKAGLSLSPSRLWWLHTAGGARALDLEGVVGNLQPGCEADFVVINPQATPLLARRTAQAQSLDELLFALIILGDDRAVVQTVVA